jgi:hypothetical protein
VNVLDRKSGERSAVGGVRGVNGGCDLVAEGGGVRGVVESIRGAMVGIWFWRVVVVVVVVVGVVGEGRGCWSVAGSRSFRRECWRLILRRALGVCGRDGGWKERGEGSWEGNGSGERPFSEGGWKLMRRGVAEGVRSRPRYCSARFSAERMSALMSMSWTVSRGTER